MNPKRPLQRFFRTRAMPLPKWLLDNKTRQMRDMAQEVGKDDIVIDLGAHVGNATIEFALRAKHVHAFEPNRENFRELTAQTRNYPNITVHEKAVSDHNGTIKLYYEKGSIGEYFKGSTIMQGKPNIGYQNAYDVEVKSIVDIVDEIGERIGLIKIDIEGAEYRVIKALLTSGRIEMVDRIFAECHADRMEGLQAEKDEVLDLARKAGCLDKISLDWN